MNVLERISKNLEECTSLGLSAESALSLSIYDSSIMDKFGCTILFGLGTDVPEIIKNTFNLEIVKSLHYYSHPDYITTFVFNNHSN